MLRGLLRLLATISLALAVIMTVMDAARSLAGDALQLTTFGAAWSGYHEASRQAFAETLGTWMPDMIAAGLFELPAVAVLTGLALLFYAGGHRREQRRRRPLIGA